eukprot:gene19766-27980_t
MLGTRCLTTCLTHQPLLPFDLRSFINNAPKLTLACAVLLLVTDVLLTQGFPREQRREAQLKRPSVSFAQFGKRRHKTPRLDMSTTIAKANPKVGFVSLGCPKALVDSERILTQLRMEGYDVVSTYQDADVVVVNTCGFIDSAVEESLDAIGDAMAENGKVIVTGCLGAKTGDQGGNLVRQMHPSVLAVTGPHATQEVMDAVHANLP